MATQMNCIFCKKDSKSSKSIEHIIPESLGNKKSVLPVGIVCDSCNNYFARKIEKIILDEPYFKSLRSRNGIKTKKGKIPFELGIIPETGNRIEVDFYNNSENKTLKVIVPRKTDFELFRNGISKEIYIPITAEPEKNKIFSRFLAKIAIETIAQNFWNEAKSVDYLISESKFNSLREYARYGNNVKYWNYYQRKVYNEIQFEDNEPKQKVYEYNIWTTETDDNALGLHLTLILYGIEFTINLFETEIYRYEKWLKENDYKIPI